MNFRRAGLAAAVASLASTPIACNSEAESGFGPCQSDADCAPGTCEMGQCRGPQLATSTETGSSSDDGTTGTTDETTSSTSTTDGGSESTTTAAATTASPTTGGAIATPCDPDSAPFMFTDTVLTASIAFDFGGMTCATSSSAADDPQLLFEVRSTGLTDITAFGIEITDASVGVLFEDPSVGDSAVTGIVPDVPVTLVATAIADMTEVTIEFEISMAGPSLVNVATEF